MGKHIIKPTILIVDDEKDIRDFLQYNLEKEESQIVSIIGDLSIDRNRFSIHFKGEEMYIPKKEFQLLELLMGKPGRVFNRDQILATVWGNDTIVGERTIDVHIRKLREKLGDDYIRTIKGVGYTFSEQ